MKKYCVLLILLCMLLLSGCGSGGYDDGYLDGYADARAELESEMEWLLEERYSDGYADGYNRISESRSDAESYACARGGFSPEEALMVIDAYERGEPLWNDGSSPTEHEYQDAVRTLYFFYMYYYDGEFSTFEDP